ncbi:MAG: FkbM family methyltransferase [Pseudomonadota bacterium]
MSGKQNRSVMKWLRSRINRTITDARRHDEYKAFFIKYGFVDDFAKLAEAVGPDRAEYVLVNFHAGKGQKCQDLFALAMTMGKRGGFFVEFGATDGVQYSNSFLLEDKYGWRGILAEPAPHWHNALKSNRRALIDTRCVWSKSGETVEFLQAAEPTHSGIRKHLEQPAKSDNQLGQPIEVTTVGLNDLLAEHGAPELIDYISLDTEGSELEILRAFDFSKHRFSVLTVEHNHRPERDGIRELLESHGYRRLFDHISDYDDWYIHPEQVSFEPAI